LNDIQFRINRWYTVPADITIGYGTNAGWGYDANNVTFKNLDMANGLGWTMEFAIPLESLGFSTPFANTEFGWEVQLNDNDSDKRDKEAKWWLSTGDDSWQNASKLGTAVLAPNVVNEELDVWHTNTGFTPTIDGVLEAGWLDYPEVSDNTYAWDVGSTFDETTVDDWTDARFFFRSCWDADNVYFFFNVWDDILVDEHANAHEQDGLEIYFDGDDSKAEIYDGVDDLQTRINHWYAATTDITFWYGTGGNWGWDPSPVVFKNKDRAGGWDLEVAYPLSSVKLDGTVGSLWGFEIQQNDNDSDHRDVMRRWWHWSNDSWKDASIFGTAEFVPFGGRTAVDEKEAPGVAKSYALSQNYPNPFNPATTIPYALKSNGRVRLAVYDLMGKEVAVLVDGIQAAGNHQAQFAGTNLTSGIYFYKLQAGDQVFTKKMTLVK
jgi:hypothetical protein